MFLTLTKIRRRERVLRICRTLVDATVRFSKKSEYQSGLYGCEEPVSVPVVCLS